MGGAGVAWLWAKEATEIRDPHPLMMSAPDPDQDPKKPVKPGKPLPGKTASAMDFAATTPRPIRFPKLRPREKTFIDPELHLAWAYLTTFGFFRS
jgi:hypothetical protein